VITVTMNAPDGESLKSANSFPGGSGSGGGCLGQFTRIILPPHTLSSLSHRTATTMTSPLPFIQDLDPPDFPLPLHIGPYKTRRGRLQHAAALEQFNERLELLLYQIKELDRTIVYWIGLAQREREEKTLRELQRLKVERVQGQGETEVGIGNEILEEGKQVNMDAEKVKEKAREVV
jgi:hypothetical protein